MPCSPLNKDEECNSEPKDRAPPRPVGQKYLDLWLNSTHLADATAVELSPPPQPALPAASRPQQRKGPRLIKL